MIKIFLANLGFRRPMYPLATPPMGLLFLAGYIRKYIPHAEIKIVNQRVENYSIDDLVSLIYEFKPNILGLSALTIFAHLVNEVSTKVKGVLPDTWVVLGGPHASSVRSQALVDIPSLDIVVPGEGEVSFKLIVEGYPKRDNLYDIPGIIWRDNSGGIVENSGPLLVEEDLDKLPFPAYDLIDLRKYWKIQSMAPVPLRRYASIVSSRGCPYKCIWCHSVFGKKIRFCSPERILDEMTYLHKNYGVDDFEFLDDNFNFNRIRVIKFAELIRNKGLKVKLAFPNAIRGDLANEDEVEALYSAGTYMCSFALETGSPRLQKFTCKNLDIPKFLKSIELMAKKGVYTNGFFMMGFPTETEEELRMTIETACNSMLHTASFFTVIPFPGTPLYEWLEKNRPEKLKALSYMNADFAGAKINLTDLPDEVLFKYQRRAMLKFYLNPKRLLRLAKVYPHPFLLSLYFPIYIYRTTKGIFIKDSD
ncbi:MAG: B12-binding domain-containing radical SAM protein [Candidatus Hydrogenedentes bacterium]|nr:B12-binding domain-containing radical SAM protein [Candidatus Hydrogenedentota bacterium]